MAKSSFAELEEEAKNENTEAKAPAAEKTDGALISKDNSTELATHSDDQFEDAGLSGDFDQGDVNLPRLNVVAKTSQMVDDGFAPGAIVLNREQTLVLKDTPLNVVVLNMHKQYQEDVAWGEERLPRVFQSKDELEAAGFSTEWGSPNLCRPLAHLTLLVEAPEGLDEEAKELFPYEFNGKLYTMAALTASKSAYKTTAKEVATFVAFAQNVGVWTTGWTLTSKLRTEGDVTWYSPALKRSGKLKPELLDFVEGVK